MGRSTPRGGQGPSREKSRLGKRAGFARGAALVAVVGVAASCNQFSDVRQALPVATLGDDIFGVFCDRVGASSLTEDLTGGSYAAVCHYDAQGHYSDTIDAAHLALLPTPATPAETNARRLSIAKLERMAQRRPDLVHAINATFPDVKIPDITSKTPGAQVRLHDALMSFAQSITPLYETNPIVPSGAPLLPSQTRAMGRLFDSMGTSQGVIGALSHMWGRRGYRPFQVGLGAVRPALAYPNLRTLTTSALALLAPGGAAASELQQVLTVMKQEMLTTTPTTPRLSDFTLDAATDQPNRPRSDLEFASSLFLTQSPAFTTGTGSQYIALRDRRGIVVPAGNTPGKAGTVPTPFADMNGDGYADVDAFGRFVDASGQPLSIDPPFAIPGETKTTPDGFGRPPASATRFSYVDTSTTLLGGLTQHLAPLLDPTVQTAPGDPNGWKQENETVMYALAGAYTLFGDRKPATYDYATEAPAGGPVAYSSFDASASPIPDLVHAVGQILADPDSDALLLSLLDLLQNHESTVARLMGAALRLRSIAAQHDMAAAAGTEPSASLAYTVPIWDQMAQLVWKITQKPGLMQALLAALASPTAVSPSPDKSAEDMGDALSKFVSFRDQLTYNKSGTHYDGSAHDSSYKGGINGPAVNITVDPNGNDQSDPKTPVDNSKPRTGTNMSCMQRSLQLIDDANGGPACNKTGATVAARLLGLTVDWPLIGAGYDECALFQFDNLAVFYLDSLLPASHPKRSYLQIKSTTLNDILSFLGAFGTSPDTLLQQSSDVTGLTTHPESFALNRLVFFGASTDNPNFQGMPDFDGMNQGTQTDLFISGSLDPVSCAYCPPDGTMVPTCTTKAGTVRVRDPNTIFLWERFGFTTYLQPIVRALADTSCGPNETNCDLTDTSGEQLFSSMVHVFDTHWPGANHGAECQSTSPSQPTYCSGAGVNNYEPILADSFATSSDLIGALNEFANVAVSLSKITVQRGPNAGQTWTGAQVMEKLTTMLFSQDYAKAQSIVDRQGKASTTWVDGTPQSQLTVFTLVADALHKIDTRFASACNGSPNMSACMADVAVRQGQWKRARSQLTDAFLSVDGTGTAAKFHNPTIAPTLIATLELARQQVNANCPTRETGAACTWAKKDLGDKLAGVIGRPLFAALTDMTDQIRQDDTSRRQLETFLQYVLEAMTASGQDLQGMLASVADILQVLRDDTNLSPVIGASASGANPDADPAGPGAGSIGIDVLKALTNDTYDRYHVADQVLPNLVTPMDGGTNLSPIEIFMDVITDVNRIDASDTSAFAPPDYGAVMSTMQSFMIDKTRGMEQLYTIIQNRPKQ
jgi:hypothetical protein